MAPNHYLAVCIDCLFRHRPQWSQKAAIGKTVVSTALIDRVAEQLVRPLCEGPVGFRWFAQGLQDGSLGFGGEESARASFLRRDGSVWATDKDGIAAALLAAEMTARSDRDPAILYEVIAEKLGRSAADRVDAPADAAQKKKPASLGAEQLPITELAGEKIIQVLTRAPGNDQPIGGIRLSAESGWFAARPSGTEAIYRIHAESFQGENALRRILDQAQTPVDRAIGVS